MKIVMCKSKRVFYKHQALSTFNQSACKKGNKLIIKMMIKVLTQFPLKVHFRNL